jgi:hypothetical protein
MSSYDQEKDIYLERIVHKAAWLHGKFYNIPDFINKYNINFKKDLVTHEDIYFNSLAIMYASRLNLDWDYLNVLTYRWVDNPNSLTRRDYHNRGYFYENFNDYIVATSEPFWEDAKDKNNILSVNQVLVSLLHCYFYYEAASYYEGPTPYKDVLMCIVRFLKRIQDELNYDLDFIVDILYTDPERYSSVLDDCELMTTKFICKTSLRDFVYNLGTMEVDYEY